MASEEDQKSAAASPVANASPSPQPGPNGRGALALKIKSWLDNFNQPWLRWFVFFMFLVVVIASIVLAGPAVVSRLSGFALGGSAKQTPVASPSEELAQPLPQLTQVGLTPFISRMITSRSTSLADFRPDVITYTVQAGDFLFAIADKFKIKPETILWSNYSILKDNPELILPGQVLNILPVDGLYYQWLAGDRLDTVAGKFGVTAEDIVLWPGNNLDPNIDVMNPGIALGTWLVVPGGHREFKEWEIPVIRKDSPTPWVGGGAGACTTGPYSGPAGTGVWGWPTASHWVVGNEYSAYHHGIDLYITLGEPIHAADRGVVVFSGWNTWGYGNLIVVDHGNGWQTVYAHLNAVLAGCGYTVNRGESIGYGGTTGNSTGPHLHFEMIYNGVRVNPHLYLP